MLELYLRIKNAFRREEGQDIVEYALLIVLIALVVATTIPTVTTALATTYGNIATALGS